MFPLYRQLDSMDCGPTCLCMVAKHYGRAFSAQTLRQRSGIGKDGVSLLGIAEAAEQIGFRTIAVTVSFQKLAEDAPLPCIVHWRQNHFVVLYKIKKSTVAVGSGQKSATVFVADPARGLRTMTVAEFEDGWISTTESAQYGAPRRSDCGAGPGRDYRDRHARGTHRPTGRILESGQKPTGVGGVIVQRNGISLGRKAKNYCRKLGLLAQRNAISLYRKE